MFSKIGCKPFWLESLDSPGTDLENCSEASQLDQFIIKVGNLESVSDEETLFSEYHCLKPCRYIEYKVITNTKTNCYVISHNNCFTDC